MMYFPLTFLAGGGTDWLSVSPKYVSQEKENNQISPIILQLQIIQGHNVLNVRMESLVTLSNNAVVCE